MSIRQARSALQESTAGISTAMPALEATASTVDSTVELVREQNAIEGSTLHRAESHLHAAQEILRGLRAGPLEYTTLVDSYRQRFGGTGSEITFPDTPTQPPQSGSSDEAIDEDYDTPLTAVQQSFFQHTNRMPADAGAVMEMISTAVGTLGSQASAFMEAITANLDPDNNESLDQTQTENLTQLGDLVNDSEASNAARWGAVSLLGVLAMADTPNPRTGEGCGNAARQALEQALTQPTDDNAQFHTLGQALLAHPPIPADEVALEFMLHDTLIKSRPAAPAETPVSRQQDISELLGSKISPPAEMSLQSINLPEKLLNKMDWLNLPPDAEVNLREVVHDGRPIARVVDLTVGNATLDKLRKNLEEDPLTNTFWDQFGAHITRYIDNNFRSSRQSAKEIKVPLLCMKNSGTGQFLIRAYFTPCGRTADGLPLLGLLTAVRTKQHQKEALAIIGVSTSFTA